jgi:hypothetical protein
MSFRFKPPSRAQIMTANVFCTARDEVRAVRLLDELEEAGFNPQQISMVVPQRALSDSLFPLETELKASRGTPLSEPLRRLSQINFIRHTEFGRCIGAGPLASKLMDSAGADTENLAAHLARADVPRGDLYAQRIAEDRILVSVHCDSLEETERVQKVLTRAGAEDLFVSGATSSQDPSHDSHLRHAA